MSDDIELYSNASCCVEILNGERNSYLSLNEIGGISSMLLTPGRARQIGLGLVAWADKEEAKHHE